MFSKGNIKRTLLNYAIYLIMLVMIIVIIAIEPSFLSLTQVSNILAQSSSRIIIALGVGGIIILGGTDLAAGRMVGMSAVITASLLQNVESSLRIYADMPRLPVILPIMLAMVVCGLFSLIHGFFVAKLKVAPFIASLGIQQVVYGLFSIYFQNANGAAPIGSLDPAFTTFAQKNFYIGGPTGFRLPLIVLYAILFTAFTWFLWNKTKVGKNMYAIGGNTESATVCGVNIVMGILIIYTIAGLYYGFAGALEAARTGSVTNALGDGYQMDAIAACVVGGVSMRGGIGKVSGVVTGVIMFQIINYGMNYIGVNPYLQYVVKGVIILIAVSIDTQKYLKKK
jgi:methyl-galactoside transport system permease protein